MEKYKKKKREGKMSSPLAASWVKNDFLTIF